MNPYQVTRDFEAALCDYTGARYAVAVNSCTAALLLCVEWHHRYGRRNVVSIPRHTYCSVPQAILRAGSAVAWRDEDWRGAYQLQPLPVWDCARRFTSGMYDRVSQGAYGINSGQFMCVSFSAAKILGIEQGGAILHDDASADDWFRKMRFDGRTEGTLPAPDTVTLVGHHFIMLPSIAAQALLRLAHLPRDNPDMEDYPYPDLSQCGAFR